MDVFLEKNRVVLLGNDQALEHGHTDFNERSFDPAFIMEIAARGKFNGIVFQKGLAERYYDSRVPIILKVNDKTKLLKGDALARQNCSVKRAAHLSAKDFLRHVRRAIDPGA
jgi:class I fructose-bisphosphate aldolase